jgi:iron(III) transport system permease protein
VAAAIPFAAPFVYLVVRNAADLGEAWAAVGEGRLVGPALRSLLLATSVALASAVIGTAAAWAVARTDLPLRRAWALILPLPLVIPSFIGAFALIAAFSPGGLLEEALGISGLPEVRGFWGAFTLLTLLSYPYVYLPALARLRSLPRPLEESARLLGRRPLRAFIEVVVPQARGAITAGALLAFLYVISDFGAVQLLRYDTLTRAIYANRLLDPAVSVALSLVLGVIALAVVAVERRAARVGLRDAGRSERPLLVPLGRWRWPTTGALGALVGVALLAPAAVLSYWAVEGLVRGSDRPNAVVNDPARLVDPVVNTVTVSVIAALVAVVIVLPIAYASVRRPGPLGEGLAGVVIGGFALPGLVTALALVFWTLNAPGPMGALYQTLPLLIGAYVIHHAALALGSAQSALAGVPPRLEDAARALGSGRLRRLVTVELPLMIPGLAAGAGLVLLSTMKELPATLLLSPPGFSTLATKIWSSAEDALFEEAAIASLLLITISAVLTWLLVVRPSVTPRERARRGEAGGPPPG